MFKIAFCTLLLALQLSRKGVHTTWGCREAGRAAVAAGVALLWHLTRAGSTYKCGSSGSSRDIGGGTHGNAQWTTVA